MHFRRGVHAIIFCCLFFLITIGLPLKLAAVSPSRSFLCANGLRVVLIQKNSLPLVNAVITFRSGSKYENRDSIGTAHMIEHMILFPKKNEAPDSDPGAELRRTGAYINGHTDQDLAGFETSYLNKFFLQGLSGFCKKVFFPELTEKGLEKEKKVVIREAERSGDDPVLTGTAIVLENLFRNHPYSRSVTGNRAQIELLELQRIRSFFLSHYRPDAAALCIVGKFNLQKAEKTVRKVFSSVQPLSSAEKSKIDLIPLKRTVELKKSMEIEKAHMFLGFLAPSFNHKDRLAFRVLTEIFSGGINPLITGYLRNRLKLVDQVTVSYVPLEEAGIAVFHMTLDPKHVSRAYLEAGKFLKMTTSFNYSSEDYLPGQRTHVFDLKSSADNQLRLRSEKGGEIGILKARSMARYLLLKRKNHHKPFDKRLRKINSTVLRKTARKYLAGKSHVKVVLLPELKNED